jgi:RNA-directed DNA polymerase
LNVIPSKKALARERVKLREMTSVQQNGVPIPQVIGELNRHLQSWANYFSYGYPGKLSARSTATCSGASGSI